MKYRQDMTNVAYSKEYLNLLKERDKSWLEAVSEDSDEIKLFANFAIKIQHYRYEATQDCHTYGDVVSVYKGDKEIYSYKCYDNSGNFHKIICHSNGHRYLLFRRDLYGYSVLDLETSNDFHYYPACHLNPGGAETFIWCDPVYNPRNDLMAVFGCYWAYPYDLILVDFKNPFAVFENPICISSKKNIGLILDDGYSWHKNTLIIKSKHVKLRYGFRKKAALCGEDIEKNSITVIKTHKITDTLCRKWLSESNNQ